MAPNLRPEDIESQTFTVVRLSEAGYRQTEVDEFLDAIHAAYTQMWNDLGNMEQKLAAKAGGIVNPATIQLPAAVAAEVAKVDEPPAPVEVVVPNGPSLSTISLLLTQAEATAAKLVADAKAEAERIKGEAYSAGAQLKNDAQAAVAQQKADAESAIAQLRDDVEADLAKAKTEAHAFVDKLKADAGSEAATLVEAARAEKAKLSEHVSQLTNSRDAILGVLKEVVAKVEGK